MNETIFITGGTGKIGAQFVQYFYNQNYNVIFTARTTLSIKTLIKKINPNKKNNHKLIGLKINLEEKTFTQKILNFIKKIDLYPNHLINCARSLDYLKINSNGLAERKEWLGEFTLDVIIPYELSMALVMQEKTKLKNIINISSIYGIVAPNLNLYNNPKTDSAIQYGVAKAAQIQLTKELAVRLADLNIKINTISYGGIEGRASEEFKKKYAKLCPLGRMLKEEEVIGAIDFLISNKSNYLTGHNLVVDGGWTIW